MHPGAHPQRGTDVVFAGYQLPEAARDGPLGISVRQTLDQILTLGQRLRQADNLSDEQKDTVAQILALSDQLLHVANQEANN